MARILLVEDNEMNADMLTRRLQRRGFEVTRAADGSVGVAMARRDQPDLILMDMSLPVMDGWQATACIRAHAATAPIPVIALTAHAMPGDAELAMLAGCDDYDTKPVEWQRLMAKIELQLRLRQPVNTEEKLRDADQS
jgi:two-component system cell cycle response regulator DivK